MITQFSFYISHLAVPLEIGNSILLHCCQRANLDLNRTCTLVAELEASQRANMTNLTPVQYSLKVREKERAKFGKCLGIGLSLDYLEPKETVKLLTICKL